jgi:hypothetical protein
MAGCLTLTNYSIIVVVIRCIITGYHSTKPQGTFATGLDVGGISAASLALTILFCVPYSILLYILLIYIIKKSGIYSSSSSLCSTLC